MLIDSHAHLDDNKYGSYLELLDRFKKAGGKYLIDVGFDLTGSVAARERAASNEGVFFAAGIHPQEADKEIDLEPITGLLADLRCVAVGEIGLDYHYEPYSSKRQIELFVRQIEIACAAQLPIIIHSRDASRDMLETLKGNKSLLGNGFLMHCYSESLQQAKNYLDLGGYFAFGGAITFKNAKKDDIIRYIPKDRLLAETDCPYMTPVPHRGKANEPSFITYVYDKIAEIRGESRETTESIIEENFFTFFKRAKRAL